MHVLLIDDDADLTAMLTEYLGAEGFVATVAYTGEQGVDMARKGRFDAVLLDIMLPGIGGLEVLRRIRQFSGVPIIMLTARGDDIDRVVGLEAGADDYIPKPYFPRELVARLNAVLRRSAGTALTGGDEEALVNGPLRLDAKRFRVMLDGREVLLTGSELNILEVLMRAPDEVLRKDRISQDALGRTYFAYDRSVDVHISNIRQKLHAVRPDLDPIETVRGVGYRMRAMS